MHRHGVAGRKLQLDAGPRRALIRGQVTSLVVNEQISTTLAKAKEIAPQFERMVTKAKKGDLHNRRQIRSFLLTDKATEKLITEIAPAFKDRDGGYTRIVKAGNRRGDNAAMAIVALTEEIKSTPAKPAEKSKAKAEAVPEAEVKPTNVKTSTKKAPVKKPAAKKEAKK
ncbi:MAG TPA: 50S ribosomal protein L17 [Candidatus Saccharimonadales bacterium]|nr:50S ribosomal protein L17 [Candidatus Saccharimonadales bacterium]